MDQEWLTELLVRASDDVAAAGFDAKEDLSRGRVARRRQRGLRAAAAVLGAAAAVAVGVSLSGVLTASQQALPGIPAGVTQTAEQPLTPILTTTALTPSTGPDTPTTGSSTTVPEPALSGFPGEPVEAAAFSRLLYSVAQAHLDPDHTRLQWSEGFSGSVGGSAREWGRKFAWQAPDDRGQAMVYVGVGDQADRRAVGCGQYDYSGSAKCKAARLANGQPAQVLSSSTGRMEVHWVRPDGSYVFVIVDPVFGNNSTVRTQSALPTMAALEDFVMDPTLVLPKS